MKNEFLTVEEVANMRNNVKRLISFNEEFSIVEGLSTYMRMLQQLARDNIRLMAEIENYKNSISEGRIVLERQGIHPPKAFLNK